MNHDANVVAIGIRSDHLELRSSSSRINWRLGYGVNDRDLGTTISYATATKTEIKASYVVDPSRAPAQLEVFERY